MDFGDSREAFRSKSSAELLRGLLVLGLCAVGPLVEHNREVGAGPAAGMPEPARGVPFGVGGWVGGWGGVGAGPEPGAEGAVSVSRSCCSSAGGCWAGRCSSG